MNTPENPGTARPLIRRRLLLAGAVLILAAGGLAAVIDGTSRAQFIPQNQPAVPQPGVFTTIDQPAYGGPMMPGGMPGAMPGMPGAWNPGDTPGGVTVHIVLADGQRIDLRTAEVVIDFPSGGSLKATANGVLPVQAAATATPAPGLMPGSGSMPGSSSYGPSPDNGPGPGTPTPPTDSATPLERPSIDDDIVEKTDYPGPEGRGGPK